MPRRLKCSLLCEDIEQEQFFRPILQQWFGRGRVYVERRKPGEQGGINYVLHQYARLVKEEIRRYPQEARGLVVVVDGDSAGLQQRLRELDRRLVNAGHDRRAADEKIAACIPCRTIETWELWLCGRRDLDEQTGYKPTWESDKRAGNVSADQAVKAWFGQLSEPERLVESSRLPSLTAGRAELAQLYARADRG